MKINSLATIILFTIVFNSSCKKETNTPSDPTNLLAQVKQELKGYKLAYGNLTQILLSDVDGTNEELLADGSPISGYVSWSSDAKYVYFASAKGPAETAWEAWRIDVKTKIATAISNFGKDVRSLGVSPDNKYLAVSIMTGNSNIGNNNDKLTQFNTDLYIVAMSKIEQFLSNGNSLTIEDLDVLIASPPADQFWYEELNWNPVIPADGIPILAYSKTWRYDEDAVSYTHAYTIKADGTGNTLIQENQDMPIWDFTGKNMTFLSGQIYNLATKSLKQLKVTDINKEVSGITISPNGNYVLFEIGDENRKAGIAKYNTTSSNNKGEVLPLHNVYEPRWSPIKLNN